MSNTYTYLQIVNEILSDANEVQFSGNSDFSSATGLHQMVKTRVNDVIKDILNREDNAWPFQSTDTSQLLTVGTESYNVPAAAAVVDWNSFYIDKVYADQSTLGTITCDAHNFYATAGSFITSGFTVGMKVRWGSLSANTGSDVTITVLTAQQMTVSETLTVISIPATAFTVTNVYLYPDSRQLNTIDINTYRDVHLTNTKNCILSQYYCKPSFAVRTNTNNIIFGPLKPNGTYLVKYQYYAQYTPVVNYNDTLIIPDAYVNTIKKGVSYYINKFRSDTQASEQDARDFEDGIVTMRRQLITQTEYVSYLL